MKGMQETGAPLAHRQTVTCMQSSEGGQDIVVAHDSPVH